MILNINMFRPGMIIEYKKWPGLQFKIDEIHTSLGVDGFYDIALQTSTSPQASFREGERTWTSLPMVERLGYKIISKPRKGPEWL